MSALTTIVWVRQDLRLDDNPALQSAVDRGAPVVPVYIWSPDEEGDWAPGGASRVWLHHSLESLAQSLRSVDSRLVIRSGDSLKELRSIIQATSADVVCFNRRYEPAAIKRDAQVCKSLKKQGVTVRVLNGSLMHDPDDVRTTTDRPYKVFTPFWKTFDRLDHGEPTAPPTSLRQPSHWPKSVDVNSLKLLPQRDWGNKIMAHWTAGESAATKRFEVFRTSAVDSYKTQRDFPGDDGTSRLSPHLHFGEISPRRIWHRLQRDLSDGRIKRSETNATVFLKEIAWREFAHHVIYHFPATTTQPLYAKFKTLPWQRDAKALRRWQSGQTGYPYIDAGLRQLWETGWMHNRVRMSVASFLVKHLLIHWIDGAKWFWDTLVDADLASNTLNWQWAAGCGADAAPYFRIFNPITQGEKFDHNGTYVRQWVPELAHLSGKHLHSPWNAPEDLFNGQLGYPHPIVKHKAARERALEALKTVTGSSD